MATPQNIPANITPSEWTRQRDRASVATLRALQPEIRARAFAVAGLEQMDALGRVRETIAELTDENNRETWEAKRKKIEAELAAGKTPEELSNPEKIAARRRHAESVLRTNAFQAAGASRWHRQQRLKTAMPYLMYRSMEDAKVRDDHAKLDGVILPIDDPFWERHTPPWDFNCRCRTIQLTRKAAESAASSGAGKMWTEADSQDWRAQNNSRDTVREFQNHPGAMTFDIRNVSQARGRTHDQMEDFMDKMESHKIEDRRAILPGASPAAPVPTISVRDWLWRPVSDDIGARAVREGGKREMAILLDAATGEILGETHGGSDNVEIPMPPKNHKPAIVIHNHPSGNPTPSPDDLCVAMAYKLRHIEAHGPNSKTITQVVDASFKTLKELRNIIDLYDNALDQTQWEQADAAWNAWRDNARLNGRIKYTEEPTHD